eukprot:TRINITY_DN2755_c0_g1_i4.p1 TRINITY_DN2755_c0_g1~~TRINITY_DN2755_c0_g1_i4.p1  ORF type:complete len:189 (+),score=42.51 TRINITY_DN2755_c0_g1_i4:780-1346(+)
MQFHNFFLSLCRINEKKNQQIEGLKNKIAEKENTYSQILETLEKERNENQDRLDAQLTIFTAILNEKKQKAKYYKGNPQQQFKRHEQIKEMDIQQDRLMEPQPIQFTQFSEANFTQMNQSLFKPSQDFSPQKLQFNFPKKFSQIEEKDEKEKEYEEECKKFTRQNQEIKLERHSSQNDMKGSLMDLFK